MLNKYVIFMLCIISSNLLGAPGDDEVMDPPIARRLEIKFSAEQFSDFEALKNANVPLAQAGLKSKLHLYRAHKSDSHENSITFLGTVHSIPLDCLPNRFLNSLQSADEVYVESESVFHLCSLKPEERPSRLVLDSITIDKYEQSILSCLMKIFNPAVKIGSLSPQQLYGIACIADCMFGMDSEITMRAKLAEKPVLMLDSPMDLYENGIEIHESQLEPEDKRPYLKSNGIIDREQLVRDYLRGDGLEGLVFPSLDEMEQELKDYSEEDISNEEIFSDGDIYRVNQRNERWFKILNAPSNVKNRLCCVGLGHFYGLLDLFKKAGYEVEYIGDR